MNMFPCVSTLFDLNNNILDNQDPFIANQSEVCYVVALAATQLSNKIGSEDSNETIPGSLWQVVQGASQKMDGPLPKVASHLHNDHYRYCTCKGGATLGKGTRWWIAKPAHFR